MAGTVTRKRVYVKVRLDVAVDTEGKEDTLIENMSYSFTSNTEGAVIEATEIQEWDVKDKSDW